MSAEQTLRLRLQPRPWTLLEAFISERTGEGSNGGYQSRRRKWRTQLNERFSGLDTWERRSVPRVTPGLCWILLDEDDVGWIQRQIRNAHKGGWEMKVANIFDSSCPEFSGIERVKRR
jgi:hypothetical protein